MKATRFMMLCLPFVICIASQCQNYRDMNLLNDSVIRTGLNEPFDLKFEACHDGGYRWFMEPADSSKLRLINKTSRSTSGKPVFGGNVFEIWTFTGLQKGDYQLLFYYKRPWLTEIEKTETVRIVVN